MVRLRKRAHLSTGEVTVASFNMGQDLQLWPNVAGITVSVEHRRIEVTTFGDQAPKFLSAGPARVHMELETDPEGYEALMGVLQTQGQYDPERDEVVFRVRTSTLARTPGAAKKAKPPILPPLEPRPVRLLNLE